MYHDGGLRQLPYDTDTGERGQVPGTIAGIRDVDCRPGRSAIWGSYPVLLHAAEHRPLPNADRELPWAQLNVYLYEDDDYCGQNTPDSPVWQPFPAGNTIDHTVTGWQIYRLPCDVTSIRAMLHNRIGGQLFPPSPGETVVEATQVVSYQLRAPAP